ncbi:hypothetical protein COCNU_02G001260 [Cocos nucifera]|uniref:Uncharacterized protein n=1 Tax=Cocos nucifera TaxID=13894 RepID=A0A8K0HXN6_COCNU|nr:hypothetical protein COCNU_02G001260 [Cocos nucifera]
MMSTRDEGDGMPGETMEDDEKDNNGALNAEVAQTIHWGRSTIDPKLAEAMPAPLHNSLSSTYEVDLPQSDRPMNQSDPKTLRRMAKKRKTSMTAALKRAQTEAVLTQPMVGGSSRAAIALRKEKASEKDVIPLWFVAPRETVP